MLTGQVIISVGESVRIDRSARYAQSLAFEGDKPLTHLCREVMEFVYFRYLLIICQIRFKNFKNTAGEKLGIARVIACVNYAAKTAVVVDIASVCIRERPHIGRNFGVAEERNLVASHIHCEVSASYSK
ncbi:hypothetical protein [Mesorhizobium sp. AA23]|uniref:hypothetical protein n=1 Tax=Mesorhizobium sp. AA23 TaxID=1854058 RepID=UPI0012E9E668|nr:hypothetical protein [Mesorhizobium sp. AA23]WIE90887.1 hypothetical protein P9270_025700 [Mesorhizobium sp. WSM4875]